MATSRSQRPVRHMLACCKPRLSSQNDGTTYLGVEWAVPQRDGHSHSGCGVIRRPSGAPNSRTTQLFVNFGDNTRLDGKCVGAGCWAGRGHRCLPPRSLVRTSAMQTKILRHDGRRSGQRSAVPAIAQLTTTRHRPSGMGFAPFGLVLGDGMSTVNKVCTRPQLPTSCRHPGEASSDLLFYLCI